MSDPSGHQTPATNLRYADAAAIAEAASLIGAGGLVAFPTETVYGLGADATSERAVAAIFAAKGRPRFNPLICHVTGVEQADRLVTVDERARALAEQFWPGPLTLVLPRRAASPLSLLVGAGLETIAVRAPDHPVARALIAAAGVPIAAPSANRSGTLSPTAAAHVAASLGARVGMILDAGACRIGIESTIVDLGGPHPALLRPGGVALEAIEAIVGPVDDGTLGPVRAPGMLARHYAPSRPLRLNADSDAPREGEVVLGFGPAGVRATLNLSAKGDLEEAAANLFAMLRALDRPGVAAIAAMAIPEVGLGRAINDRLRRAAAPAPADKADDDWNDDRGPSAPCVLPGMEDD